MSNPPPLRDQLVVFQLAVPDYRVALFDELDRLQQGRFRVLAGDISSAGVRSAPELSDWAVSTRTRSFIGRRLMWQRSSFRSGSQARVAIVELNPRNLTSWLILAARRLRSRPTVAWGHAWPRRGRGARTDRVRGVMRRLSDVVVVYTETQARELRTVMRTDAVLAAPNAILRAAEIQPAPIPSDRAVVDLCYVGRLAAEKKPDLLLKAWLLIEEDLPTTALLHIVGDGPLRASLEKTAATARRPMNVIFHGHVSDLRQLCDIYATCIASVSPGYVGLSLTQSISLGVPMIIAEHEPHSPEIEAARPGFNATFFESDSPQDLGKRILERIASSRSDLAEERARISHDCRTRYSVEVMAQHLLMAAESAVSKRRRRGHA